MKLPLSYTMLRETIPVYFILIPSAGIVYLWRIKVTKLILRIWTPRTEMSNPC
jgi:hypothetical protein